MKIYPFNILVSRQAAKTARYIPVLHHNQKPDTIHRFRITCQELRALLSMVDPGETKNYPVAPQLLRLYRKAGKLRNWQVLYKTPELQTTSAAKLRKIIHRRIKVSKRKLRQYAKKIAGVQAIAMDTTFPTTLTKENIRFFQHRQITRSLDIVQQVSITDNHFHALRKYLKQYVRTLPFIGLYFSNTLLLTEKKAQLQYGKSLTQSLGNYHDACVQVELLSALRRKANRTSRAQLKKMISALNQRKTAIASSLQANQLNKDLLYALINTYSEKPGRKTKRHRQNRHTNIASLQSPTP